MTSVHGETGVTREFAGFPRNAASSLESGGRLSSELGRELGVSKHTVYAWKAKYGGMSVGEAQRLRQSGP
jgi:transposase